MGQLAELRTNKGSTKNPKRVGRGKGSGHGQTSGKGHKGQTARSGGSIARGFEGGQTPMQRRLPKFGFKNIFKTTYNIVSLDQLDLLTGEVTPEVLQAKGMAKRGLVKILANGKISKSLTVKAHKFSGKAKEAIEQAGGQIEVIK